LKVSRSGYYAWSKRKASRRELEDARLSHKIIDIHRKSRGTYGSPRIHETLKLQGIFIGKKRVERLMQQHQLQARLVKVTRRQAGFRRFVERGENLRLGQPEASQLNQVWVSDITYIKVKDQYKYLIAIMDIYSRRIISWSLTETRTVSDTLKVLRRAISERQPQDGLIFHTDRGIEFTGYGFRDELEKHGIRPSVNRLGHCTDNGHMESFFHSLKIELIRGRKFNTMDELRYALNSYINHFYNKKRLHSGIGYYPPIEYERIAA
jgi:transposase InsO family protein